jgi:Cu+-exporting ATPase
MRNLLSGCLVVALATVSLAADAPTSVKTKATYSISGLHCAPCTMTVENSIKKIKGVQSITVDWNTKNAKVEFDESVLSAQALAKAIGATPHMMGSSMKYEGWLALKVPSIKDDATAKTAQAVLEKVTGVAKVATYIKQQSVAIEFKPDGALISQDLIKALADAGIEAGNL